MAPCTIVFILPPPGVLGYHSKVHFVSLPSRFHSGHHLISISSKYGGKLSFCSPIIAPVLIIPQDNLEKFINDLSRLSTLQNAIRVYARGAVYLSSESVWNDIII